jgi:hypothetical protein
MYTDLKRWDGLLNEVLGDDVTLDYSAMFGTPPSDVTREDMAKQWEGIIGRLDSSQHLITWVSTPLNICIPEGYVVKISDTFCRSLLIELPQPDEANSLPMTAKVIANVSVTLVRKAAKGDPIARNGVCTPAYQNHEYTFHTRDTDIIPRDGDSLIW